MPEKKVSRSAKSGEFVTKAKAKSSPATTVTETVKKSPAVKKVVAPKAPEKTSADLERDAEFARKAKIYRIALGQGTNPEYPYGDPQDPQWAEVREAVKAQIIEEEAVAEAESQRVREANEAANAEALALAQEALAKK